MRSQLIVGFVVEPFQGCLFDRAVHSLDLPAPRENGPPDRFLILAAPRMVEFRQPVPDPVGLADHVEAHRPGIGCVTVPRLLCELNAIACKYGVDLVGDGIKPVLQELPGGLSVSRCNELRDGKPGRSVNAHKEKELAPAVCTSAIPMWKKPMG